MDESGFSKERRVYLDSVLVLVGIPRLVNSRHVDWEAKSIEVLPILRHAPLFIFLLATCSTFSPILFDADVPWEKLEMVMIQPLSVISFRC